MKKIKITIIFVTLSVTAWSQTNTFPPSGYVGIGTNSPQEMLHIEKNGNTFLRLKNSGTNGSVVNFGPVSSNGKVETQLQFENEFGLFDHAQSVWRFKIKSNGNVGIGTISPDEKLEVSGDRSLLFDHESGSVHLRRNTSGGWAFGYKFYGTAGTDYGGFGGYGSSDSFNYYFIGTSYQSPLVAVQPNGNVGIGTSDPQSKLAVNGQIRATEVKVLADISVPDYVFEPGYQLRTLQETKTYISENKHLPEIPSAAEINENGIDLGDMNMRLLKKIEELTLYQIELMEEMEKMKNELQELKKGGE